MSDRVAINWSNGAYSAVQPTDPSALNGATGAIKRSSCWSFGRSITLKGQGDNLIKLNKNSFIDYLNAKIVSHSEGKTAQISPLKKNDWYCFWDNGSSDREVKLVALLILGQEEALLRKGHKLQGKNCDAASVAYDYALRSSNYTEEFKAKDANLLHKLVEITTKQYLASKSKDADKPISVATHLIKTQRDSYLTVLKQNAYKSYEFKFRYYFAKATVAYLEKDLESFLECCTFFRDYSKDMRQDRPQIMTEGTISFPTGNWAPPKENTVEDKCNQMYNAMRTGLSDEFKMPEGILDEFVIVEQKIEFNI